MGEAKQEHDQNQSNSKYLLLWVCVIICAGIIFTGWLFSMKYNFEKINEETAAQVNKTSEQATQEVLDMFDGAGNILKQGDAEIQKIKEEQQEKNEQQKIKEDTVTAPVGQLPETK